MRVGEDEDPVGKRADVHSLHRRSKSASDRNVGDVSRLGVTNSVQKRSNLPHDSPASRRTYGSQTPPRGLHVYPTTSSSNPRASLEKDIQLLQLKLQQEKSMRAMLERAIGRASSTLSPGHRHFGTQVQTKELIAEIELLEEEVANREQHVLSLYRDIFEQCVSKPPSEQGSGLSSPAHVKMKPRKHPSIIKSAFCSSKKFPLQPFRVLSSRSNSDKKDVKIRHASVPAGKPDLHFEKTYSNIGRSTTTEKTSMIRTLKDHLYQCPSNLSEEMVRCMAAVYCWLLSPASLNSENQSSDQSCRQEDHTCNSLVEISSIPSNKSQLPKASHAINNYRALVEQLEKVNISQMDNKAQIAFWINVYNSLIMHAYLAYGIPTSSLRRLAMFHKAAYNIGGHVVSASAIEHSIFCFHSHRIGGWLETIMSTAMRKKSGNDRQVISSKFGLPNSQSLVCFALCTGSFSDPVLKVYTASNVKDQLESAKREYLNTNVMVKNHRKLFLPKLLERYSRETSIGSDDLIKWVCLNVDKTLSNSIEKCMESQKSNKKAAQIIEWLPYSSKFRYLFSKELATKPWWI
ncbi:hypothetical protein V2J09_020670 [Rumex salicifolius]